MRTAKKTLRSKSADDHLRDILAVEVATGRNFSVKLKERILFAGFSLVVLLMVTVI